MKTDPRSRDVVVYIRHASLPPTFSASAGLTIRADRRAAEAVESVGADRQGGRARRSERARRNWPVTDEARRGGEVGAAAATLAHRMWPPVARGVSAQSDARAAVDATPTAALCRRVASGPAPVPPRAHRRVTRASGPERASKLRASERASCDQGERARWLRPEESYDPGRATVSDRESGRDRTSADPTTRHPHRDRPAAEDRNRRGHRAMTTAETRDRT